MTPYTGPKSIPKDYPKCMNCGRTMKPEYDEVAKKVTGYIWSCECMPPNMKLSIG